MCGFVAIHQWEEYVKEDELRLMTEAIAHRGPDDQGFLIDRRTGFGFQRLSILDQQGGRQPMVNKTRDLWIVFNGEIYNHASLRRWLGDQGYNCTTRSDTEVILRLYEAVGQKAPRYLRGMFAFVLWDGLHNRLFGARDPFGIKPLCYTHNSRGVALSSETKSLLMYPHVPRDINPLSAYHYFTFQYVPEPATMFTHIHKVPAGCTFVVRCDGLQNHTPVIESYTSLELTPDESIPLEEHITSVRSALFDSVKVHRQCDVSYGSFLSSGIDSACIAALLRCYGPLHTFSVGFSVPTANELEPARQIANFLGTEHHEMIITSQDFMENLSRLSWYFDEPVADPAAIPLYFVAQMARRYVKVTLSGEGADELFGGYGIYREPHMLRVITSMPKRFRRTLATYANRLPEGLYGRGYLLRGSTPLEQRFIGNARIFSESMKNEIFRTDFLPPEEYGGPQDITKPLYASTHKLDDVTRMQFIDIHTWLRGDILVKSDKMSMAHSLETRVPFLDSAVFAAAKRIPTQYRIRNATTKWILREAMRSYLPKDVIQRPKLGFPVPLNPWLKNDLHEWALDLLTNSKSNPIIDTGYALKLLDEHFRGRKNHSRAIWTVLMFLLWYSIYVEQLRTIDLGMSPRQNFEPLPLPIGGLKRSHPECGVTSGN
ncbi:asparagine synthase (glutamine-hydrolyzing) [Pasteuria penetrans]|uniref:asparagine synthase (glutamine-hydrolyzing) n=1 Tax=Pasteuria penetrans TaxID=86005 RepID=UPI000FC2B3DB|nr:asparagine synthase (glutamine-hydrolyzing) [Pasteuria penetrans]